MSSTTQCMTLVQPSPHHGILWSLGHWARNWLERDRARRSLAEMDDRDLRDLGLSRLEIEREIARHDRD